MSTFISESAVPGSLMENFFGTCGTLAVCTAIHASCISLRSSSSMSNLASRLLYCASWSRISNRVKSRNAAVRLSGFSLTYPAMAALILAVFPDFRAGALALAHSEYRSITLLPFTVHPHGSEYLPERVSSSPRSA